MDFEWFQLGPIPLNAITGKYNLDLVVLSYFVASLASFVAFELAACLRSEQRKTQERYWLIGGACVMGTGIWSMHFIGMLAFIMPMTVTYHSIWTYSSLLVAIIASGFALFLIKDISTKKITLISGGILLGLGIALMHYMGMMAMNTHATIRYLPQLFFLSIVIAILASEAALGLLVRSTSILKENVPLKIVSALIMGAAICGMHYTGMAAAVFTPMAHTNILAMDTGLDLSVLGYLLGGAVSLILLLLLSTYYKHFFILTEKNFLNTVLKNLQDGVLVCDAKGRIVLANPMIQYMLHQNVENQTIEQWTKTINLYSVKNDKIEIQDQPLLLALSGKRISNLELIAIPQNSSMRNIIVDSQPIMNYFGHMIGAVMMVSDITERKHMEEQLIHQATHDTLTSLPNRVLLRDRIERAIQIAKRLEVFVAVLFFDLDRFKMINDALGHHVGDIVLREVAQRLKNCFRSGDTVARLGGDEFIVVLHSVKKFESIGVIAKKLLQILARPIDIGETKLSVISSIGISFFPEHGEDVEILIKNADIAMYQAKQAGGHQYKFYHNDMDKYTLHHIELENFMYQALEQNLFELHYQPIIDLKSGTIISLEALIRLNHPTLGMIAPGEFIPLAEKSHLIVMIGEWVLRTACQQNQIWLKQGVSAVRISVNLASRQFKESNLVELVTKILEETHLPADFLGLEITESVILEQTETVIKTLHELRNMGVQISLDDFGTGFSSLSYLKRLPVDKVKIDKSFVKDLSSNDFAIVSAIIAMAKSLNLKVVAEGTETEEQLSILSAHECHETQGFYFSKPLNAADCLTFLEKKKMFD